MLGGGLVRSVRATTSDGEAAQPSTADTPPSLNSKMAPGDADLQWLWFLR